MINRQSIRSRKSGCQPDSARGQLARRSTSKLPVGRDSQAGCLPKKEAK
jgi:hypothetical protein